MLLPMIWLNNRSYVIIIVIFIHYIQVHSILFRIFGVNFESIYNKMDLQRLYINEDKLSLKWCGKQCMKKSTITELFERIYSSSKTCTKFLHFWFHLKRIDYISFFFFWKTKQLLLKEQSNYFIGKDKNFVHFLLVQRDHKIITISKNLAIFKLLFWFYIRSIHTKYC